MKFDVVSADPPEPRPAARLLILDPLDRLLLLHGDVPDHDVPRYWYTPGGALEAGESYEDAARRELMEELGLSTEIGPWVWTRREVWRMWGRLVESLERFFVVRVQSHALVLWRVSDVEANYVDEHRWWTAEDIKASNEVFFPSKLGEWLSTLVREGPPKAPVEIDP